MPLYFITGNESKFKEIKALMPEIEQLNIDLPELQEIDAKKIIEAKLKAAFSHHSGEFIVEDTSLYLDCLNGLPGPLIKWFLRTVGNIGLFTIADNMKNYKATAKTIIGYANGKGTIHFFEGKVKGSIVKPGKVKGFGWDVVFKPDGKDKSFAEMGQVEKNKISMRHLAVEKLLQYLDK